MTTQDNTKEERVRLTVDLTIAADAKLTELKKITDTTSKSEVIREAIKIYEFLAKNSQEGASFYIEKNGKMEKLLMVGLLNMFGSSNKS